MSNVVEQEYQGPPQHASQPAPIVPDLPGTSTQLNVPTKERQRAVRACNGCRRTKEKCIGVPCRRCVRLQRRCEFTNLEATRRLTSNARVSGSRRSAETSSTDTSRDRAVYLERILKHYEPDIDFGTDSLRQKALALDHEDTDSVQEGLDSPESDSGGDVTVQDENCTINAVNDTIAHYSGEFSYWNFSMRLNQQVKGLMDSDDQRQIPHYWRVEQLNSSSNAMSDAHSNLPPLHIAEFLVRVFLRHAASNYFYVESRWLLDKLKILYNTSSDLPPKDAGMLAIMLSIFAIAAQYAHLESPNKAGSRSEPQNIREDELGALFYQQAARLLPEVIHLGSLESVQACLLFGLYALPIDASGLGYIYLNLAMKLAMQNGMHRRISEHVFSPEMINRRNKVWWTVYCTEKKISIYHGRPISALPSDVDAELPQEESDSHAIGSPSETSNLLILIKLTDYLGKFADDILLLRKSPKSQISGILNRLISRKDELNNWWGTFSLKTKTKSRANLHLQLENCLIRMFVGRPFLVGRDVPGLSPGSEGASVRSNSPTRSGSRKGSQPSTRRSRTSVLVDDCVQSATEAIDLCRFLRDSGAGLANASYIEYSSCRAALLVLIAFCIRTQTLQCYDHLERGMEIIRGMSATGESARHEVLLIETLDKAVKRLHRLDLRKQSTKTSELGPKIGYDDFKQWGATWKSSGSKADFGAFQQPSSSTTTQVQRAHEPSTQIPGTSHSAPDVGSPITSTEYVPADTESEENTFLGRHAAMAAPDLPFFASDNMFPGPNDLCDNSERMLMENFLAIPEYEFSFLTGMDDPRQSNYSFSAASGTNDQTFHQTGL